MTAIKPDFVIRELQELCEIMDGSEDNALTNPTYLAAALDLIEDLARDVERMRRALEWAEIHLKDAGVVSVTVSAALAHQSDAEFASRVALTKNARERGK